MTKQEVRAAALAKLAVRPTDTLWDVGAGTGSVSVELALAAPRGHVYAVECAPDACALIRQNREKFHAYNLSLIEGTAPQVLADLPAPDAVFIGGHGGRLGELIDRIDAVLAPGGRVVINAVLDSSRHAFESAIARLGYRSLPALRLQVDAHNPIAVLAAEKPSVPIQEKRP